jgi:TM2 domain-containing membrane protein YozV
MVIRLKRCPKCQSNVERDLAACPKCGNAFSWSASRFEEPPAVLPPHLPVDPAPHDVSIALSASLLLVGTGQMYNRQVAKGMVMLLVSLAALPPAVLSQSAPLIVFLLVLWLISICDAALIAGRVLNQEMVRPWQWF